MMTAMGTFDIIWNNIPTEEEAKENERSPMCGLTVCSSIEKRHDV